MKKNSMKPSKTYGFPKLRLSILNTRLLEGSIVLAMIGVLAVFAAGVWASRAGVASKNQFVNSSPTHVTIAAPVCVAPATVYVDDDWTAVTPGTDPDGAGPATDFGCDSFATIQGGIDGVASGGTVIVNAGTYTQASSINLNKSIVLQGPNSAISPNGGARVAEAIIAGTASSILRISSPGSPVTIRGFKFDSTNVVDAYDPALDITIRKNIFSNGTSNGTLYFLNAPVQLTIDDNHLTNAVTADNDAIFVAGNWNGTTGTVATITNNVIENTPTDSSSGMNLSNVSGTVSGNQFTKLRYYAILLANNSSSMTVSNNVFDGMVNPDTVNVPTWGSGVRTYTPAFTGPVSITGNTFKNSYAGVGIRGVPNDPGADITGMNIHVNFNRFINNTFGVSDGAAGTLDAENNWWGCNYGPGTGGAGCSAAPNGVGLNGTAIVDADPWIVLGTSASPTSIGPGGNSTVTADMTHNSAAATPAGGPVPLIPVSFNATNGTMAPPTGTITAGTANSTFTSNSASSGTGCATVDNQNTCTNITVTLPSFTIDDVTHNEGDSGTTSFTFTITKTGATTFNASVDYATVNGTATAPTDFTAIPTTNLVFLPADTTKQVTVLVNGDTTIEPTEAFTVHLSNPSGATIADADGTGTITNDDTCPAFVTVYVDDNWVGTTPGTDPDGAGPATNFGCDSFATIQEGVNAVTSGGTVIVRAGTYAEAVLINKPLNLMGAQAGQNANTRYAAFVTGGNGPKANPAIESVLTAATTDPNNSASDTLHIAVDNVHVDGFVIDGNNPSLNQTGAIAVGGINTDSRRGIETDNAGGSHVPANNTLIQNNIVQNFAQRCIELVNGANSGSAPASTGSVINGNVISNFGFTGALLAFNAYADVTANTFLGPDLADASVMVQDYTNNSATPRSINISNNTVTVGQDSIGLWANLMHAPGPAITHVNFNNNTVNAAAAVTGTSGFTFGIYLTSLQVGTTPQVSGNIVGASGGQFARGIALWNLPTTTPTAVTGGTIGRSVKGVSLHDNDPNFGLAGSNSAVALSGVSIDGTGVSAAVGVLVDATGSTGDTVAMEISGNASILNTTTAVSVVGANASANIHNNSSSIHGNTVGISVDGGSATITSNNLFNNGTGLRLVNSGTGTAHFNRIISTTTAIDNPNNQTPNLENNWWGCNAGPGNAGCGAVTGSGADFNPWIVLGAGASPSAIPPFGNSTITADMTHNSAVAVPSGTLPDMPVSWSATNGTMAPPTGTVTSGTASSTFTSTSNSSGTGCATVDNQQSCANVTVFPTTVTITPATTPTASDNDYTRINNAVQATFNGQTIKLLGTFNWTEANAAASWAKGSNGIAGDLDDYSILVPANINNVMFTADNLGDATIQGPGDLPALDLEGVFFFNGGDNQNWTISNIRFLDFDLAIGMFSGAGGTDAFNNTHITNNYIRMARDVASATDTLQNIAIYYSFGTNQVISGNTIDIQGDAVTVGGNNAADIGMQCDTSGGNVYNGLQITNNTIHVLNAQSANPEVIIGIWENAHGHTSNITVSGNTFTNLAGGNSPASNLQRGFRVTSHSSPTSTVTYQNNNVSGANIGFQWISGSAFAGNLPVVVKSNTITGNGTGVLVQSQGLANLSFNRIVGNTTGLNNVDGTVTAENNWWGCNAGPGNAGCDAVTGVADFNPWIVLGAGASPSSIGPGGDSTVTADMTHNSAAATPAGGPVPLIPVSFSATNGTMAPPTGTITAGQATSTFTSTNSSSGTGCATVDNQQSCANITVTVPSFTIDDVTHNEGNAGTTSYIFTITKTGAGAASVDYHTVDGTATAPSDYTAVLSTTVNFLSADTTKQVTVLVNGDTAFEGNETFTVHLSNPVGATIADADGVGTITNDDTCGAFSTVYVDDSWVGTPIGSDPDGAGPATYFGCDSFATIQEGVTAVTAGGTVIVADGTYTENVSITKALTLKGNQFGVDARGRVAAESIVIPATPGTPTFGINVGGLIVIDGFSFSGGPTGASGVIFTSVGPNNNMQISNNRFSGYPAAAVWMNRGGSDITIDKNVMDGSNLAGSGQAIFGNGPQSYTGLFITNNNIINNAGRYGFFVDGVHNVGESATRAPSISGNLFNNNLQGLNLGSRSFGTNAAPILGAFGGTISNNTFSNNTANGVQAGIQHVLVSGNTFSNNATSGLALTSFGNAGADRGAQNSMIIGNTFTGNGGTTAEGLFFTASQAAGTISTNQAHFNRFVGNFKAITYNGTESINVENNWFGCNAGPGAAGCDALNGTGAANLDANPWIVLGTSASPNPTTPGGTSTVTADMTHNSDALAPAGGPVPLIPVSFSATNGTMAPPTGTITAGQATSTFTSNSASSGTGCATVDNQNTCTNITVTLPSFTIDDVTHNEGDSGTTSFTFTITKTGATTFNASVDYATVNGTATAPSDFTAIPTTNVVFLPADTTKQVTVLVNGDTTIEPTEAFTIHLSNPVGATIADADGTGTITNDDNTVTISGHVSYADPGTPTKNVTMTLTAPSFTTQTTLTDVNGDYSFTGVPVGNNYTVTPSKTGDANDIESFDASKVARFVAGLDVPTTNQTIAADADGDGNLTSLDASLIARYVAGLPGFGNVGTWKFVPANHSYPALATNQTSQNFTAILIGDPSGDWVASRPRPDDSSKAQLNTPMSIGVSLPNMNGPAGSIVIVPITVGDLTGQGVKAYDLQVSFNSAILQPDATPTDTAGTISSGMLITPNATNPGHLIVSAFQATDLSGSGTLIKLRFTVVGTPGQSTTLNFEDYTDPNTIFHPGFRFNAGSPAATQTNGSVTVTSAIPVSLPNANGAAGSTVTIPITVGDLTGQGVKAYDLQVSFNSAILQPDATPTDTAGTISSGMLITPNATNPGHLIVSAFQATDLSGSGTLIKLRFTVVGTPGQSTTLNFEDYTDPNTIFHPGFRFNAGTPPATLTNGSFQVRPPTAASGSVGGHVVDQNGNPLEGVAIRMGGSQNRLTVTDALGNYHFDNVDANGFYTVVPTRSNFTFSPSQRSFNVLGQHTEAAFNATTTGESRNPLEASEYFVRQQYVDFLNREPDEAGLNFWVNNIESCGADAQCREVKRIDTSAAFFLSIEFQQTGYLVYRTYQSAYGDLPNTPIPLRLSEFQPDTRAISKDVIVTQGDWEKTLENNKEEFMTTFVGRSRFVSVYPVTMTPSEFVDKLFMNAGVVPSTADRGAVIDEFGSATTTSDAAARARALRRIAESSALIRKDFDQAFVLMQYFGYLQRDADGMPDTNFDGYNFWLTKLNNFKGNYQNAEMVRAFMMSDEYRGRFRR